MTIHRPVLIALALLLACEGPPEALDPMPARSIAAPAFDASARWQGYGYDLDNTQFNPHEAELTSDRSHELVERWRIKIPAGATSTPVVWDDAVYFGGWDGQFYAADADTGELRWQRQVTTMLVRSTPLVTDDRVYVAAGANLVALDRLAGDVVFETLLDPTPEAMIDSSPKQIEDLILIGTSSVEGSFDKVYTFEGAVVAVDANTGERVWSLPTTGAGPGPCVGGPGTPVWSTAAIDPDLGLAFIGTGQAHAPPSSTCGDSLLAVHYARSHIGSRLAWKAQYTREDVFASSPITSLLGPDADIGAAPNLFEAAGRKLVGAGDKGGSYRVFDRLTGALVWHANLDMGALVQVGGVMTTAAVHDQTVYVASNHIDTGKGLAGMPDAGDYATIYALDTATGRERWKAVTPNVMFGSFAIAAGSLFHPTLDGGLYARSLDTGELRWSTALGLKIGVGPSIARGRVYVSAGFDLTMSTAVPAESGGAVSSFAVTDGPATVWTIQAKPPTHLTREQCLSGVNNARDWPEGGTPTPRCAACLCDCDATAAGHCDSCWLQAPCIVGSCADATKTELRSCVATSCSTKLLPSYVFERSFAVAPCASQCAQACGFSAGFGFGFGF